MPSPRVDANGVYIKSAARRIFPKLPKTSSLSAPMNIKGMFDGGNVGYDRGKGACSGQREGGDIDAANIIGGGANNASDKIIQRNGGGTVNISSYCVQDFRKLDRTCGNCKTQYKRIVNINDIIAKKGKVMVGVNSNYGDVATLKNNQISGVSSMCDIFQGNTSGKVPAKLNVNRANAKYVQLLERLDECTNRSTCSCRF
ncbi:unnamed protein product [Rhizoctonia solani]|uniref:Pectate lyase n=1 Tax=Rhizoctonia solani TaxID=456999 RepID=A0A8H3BNK3_9AGAM|nr:unnamed protein product [Rhizoctonia solani]